MIEFLESLEPYTSYRFALGLVLFGLTTYWLWTGFASLRSLREFIAELNRQAGEERLLDSVRLKLDPDYDVKALPPLKARPGQIIKLALLSALLRLLSFKTFRRVWPELIGCLALLPACLYAYWLVFSMEW